MIDIDTSRLSVGLLGVNIDADTLKTPHKVRIQKAGVDSCAYTVGRPCMLWYPLQMGNGAYEFGVFENVRDNQYKTVYTDTLMVNMSNPDAVFLQSCVHMLWDKNMECIREAQYRAHFNSTAYNKANVIWQYLMAYGLKYDTEFAKRVIDEGIKYDFMPDIDKTYREKTGLCYDFTALFNSMLRSVGVKAKMVHGWPPAGSPYHAWSEIYVNGKWETVDITFDIAIKDRPQNINERKASEYKPVHFY